MLVFVFGASAAAQSTSQIIAQTSGPFSGSVASGAATVDPLPLTLADAIERGLKHNLGLISIEQQVESARGSRLRTLRELMPRIDARMSDTSQTTNLAAFGFDSSLFPGIPSVVGPFNIFDARVAGSQTVFDLGALNDVRSKTAALNAARLDSLNARETVIFVITNLYFQARTILLREEGQDLVEYALVVALIAFGAIAGMGALATGLNNAFSQIALTLTTNVS